MARKKADKVFNYPTRLSQNTGEEVYKEAQRERGRLGRPVPLGEILDRAWAAYSGRPDPTPQPEECEPVRQLREMLEKDPERLGKIAAGMVDMLHGGLSLIDRPRKN